MNRVWNENGQYSLEFAGVVVRELSVSWDAAAALYTRMEHGRAAAVHVPDLVEDWFGTW